MRKFIVFFVCLFVIINFAKGQTPSNDSHWQLLWQDEFTTIDPSVWYVENNFDHYGEPQMYTWRPDNIFVSGGILTLRARSESYMGHGYTSAMLHSQPSSYLAYGYMESRIKLPYGNGLWPAFWTFTGPPYQEIDVFEMVPGAEEYCFRGSSEKFIHNQNIMTSNIHLNGPSGDCSDPYASGAVSSIQDYTQWHTYGIEWSPSRIIWYLDGYPIRYYTNSQIVAPTSIILNLAINPNVTVTSSFPADMLVDYVKVYTMNEDCDDYINTTNYDFSLYNNVEKNYIRIGDGGGNNSIQVGDDVKLRASQYVEISGNFEVPLGASFYMDANKDCLLDLGRQCSELFNPCTYNFATYDNSVKSKIELGGGGCTINIVPPTSSDIVLQATAEVHIQPGITITPIPGHSVELKIVSCPP